MKRNIFNNIPFLCYNVFGDFMNGGRGAKGSINDRLISLMYRNRYKKFQLKKEAYAKEAKLKERNFLKSIQTYDVSNGTVDLDYEDQLVVVDALEGTEFSIPVSQRGIRNLRQISSSAARMHYGGDDTASSLHNLSEEMVSVDPLTEELDIENYDYYEVISKKSKVAGVSQSDIVDVKREISKVEDEITIVDELEKFITDSKVLLDEISLDIDTLRKDIKEKYTEEQMDEIQERYKKIKEKVDKLKAQYDAISQKYDFEDFHLLENITMIAAIDEYRDLATLDEVETLVAYCKDEIEQIDGIIIESEKTVYAGEEVDAKTDEIKKREEDFKQNQSGVIYLDDLEKKIAFEAGEQRELIAEIEKKLANFTTEVREVTDVVFHTERLFGSFLRIAAGLLTAPFSGRRIFGTFLGVQLINRGVRDLRASLEPDYVRRTEIVHSYTSVELEILNSMDHVKDTARVIDDSIDQLDKFEEEFKEKFEEYSSLIPEYSNLERQIADLKKKLAQKQKEVKTMQNDLSRQYEANKVKVKKAA